MVDTGISYDAGVRSERNARLVVEPRGDHLFGLEGTKPTLLEKARRLPAGRTAERAEAVSGDVPGRGKVVMRRAFLTDEMAGYLDWEHLGTVVRFENETLDREGKRVAYPAGLRLVWLRSPAGRADERTTICRPRPDPERPPRERRPAPEARSAGAGPGLASVPAGQAEAARATSDQSWRTA